MPPLFLPRTQANQKSILNKYTLNSYRNFMACFNLYFPFMSVLLYTLKTPLHNPAATNNTILKFYVNGFKWSNDAPSSFIKFSFFFLIGLQSPLVKKILDGYENQRVNYRRQKGSKYHPARSCRDLQLDSSGAVKSGKFAVSLRLLPHNIGDGVISSFRPVILINPPWKRSFSKISNLLKPAEVENTALVF